MIGDRTRIASSAPASDSPRSPSAIRSGEPSSGTTPSSTGRSPASGSSTTRTHALRATSSAGRPTSLGEPGDAIVQRREPLGGVAVARVPGVPGVDVGERGPEQPVAVGPEHHRHAPRRLREQHRVLDVCEASLERHALAREQATHDLERLLEPRGALPERDAERAELGLVPAGADPEDEPSATHLVHRRRHPGEDPGRVERRASDQRAEPDAFGGGREGRERRPRVPRPSFGRPSPRYSRWSPSQTESKPVASAERAIETISGQRTSRSTSGSWTPTLSCPAHRPRARPSPPGSPAPPSCAGSVPSGPARPRARRALRRRVRPASGRRARSR